MEENNGFGPPGICYRLFNFIMSSFLIRGTKRIVLGTSKETLPHDHVIGTDGHEMQVEFRHSKKKSALTSGQVLIKENENSTQTHKKKGSHDQGNSNGGQEKVAKKSTLSPGHVLVHENTTTTPGNNRGREKTTKRSTLTIVDGGNLPGRKHHLLDVTSNINEKADEFIRSRKEAMEKALSMKQKTDVW